MRFELESSPKGVKLMNVLCSAAKNKFWLDVFDQLKGSAFKPVYWVGSNKVVSKKTNCFFHDVWEAFSLQGCVPGWEAKADSLSLSWVTRVEYYNYLKILDRVDGSCYFSFSERDDLFKRQLAYWSFVLDNFNIDLVFFSNTPHLPYDYPLYLCARRKGVKVLMFNVSSVVGWNYITEELGGGALRSDFVEENANLIDNLYFESVEKFIFEKHQQPWYMKAQSKRQKSLRLFLESNKYASVPYHFFGALFKFLKPGVSLKLAFSASNKYKTIKCYEGFYRIGKLGVFDISRLKVMQNRKKKELKGEYSSFSSKLVPESLCKFIYFPLHYQPELTTTPLGGEASDQFYVIRELSKALPDGVKLVVKEHPSQYAKMLYGGQGRYLGCWEAISHLPNVLLCDMSVPSISLIKHAEGVVTITGTAGWEAIVNRKTSFHFGGAWYQNFPQANKLDFDNMRSKLVSSLNAPNASPVESADLCKYFGNYAIKADIHGLFKKQSREDVLRTVNYIKRSIDTNAS
ncbi:Capsule polysaccharide biosynthesis protein [Marinobacter sp. LV10R510-11A]|nr:Capsule polysaccharide biosynthesis protein [Marinobacter sp. LV10R510-11A]